MRRRCKSKGHRWIQFIDGYRPAIQGCSRWFCGALRPDPLLPAEMRESLQRKIDTEVWR